jgi:hypothetical protein
VRVVVKGLIGLNALPVVRKYILRDGYNTSKREDSSIVITSVVKNKVTNCILVYTKLL